MWAARSRSDAPYQNPNRYVAGTVGLSINALDSIKLGPFLTHGFRSNGSDFIRLKLTTSTRYKIYGTRSTPSSLMPIRIWTAHADRTVPTHRLPPEQSDTAVNGSSGDTGLAGPPHGDPAPQISINRTLCEKEVKANPIIVHLLAIETQLVLLTMARGSEAPPLPR
jgi:hypothetical protein